MQPISLDIDTSEISGQDPSKIKIVIGVTGKIDSLVSAFLLQKQGFQCIAVGILNWHDSKYNFNLDKTCSVNNLEQVKAMCDKINIPFYAVDAQKEFRELVVNEMVTDRLVGNAHWPCLQCHKLKMTLLHEKMKKLGAHFIATGHYSKCYKNHANQTYSIHSATDRLYDQSTLLGGIPQEILRKLILPLAELSKTEVMKLAKKFHFGTDIPETVEQQNLSDRMECFGTPNEFNDFVVNNVPNDFREHGSVLDAYARVPLAEHQGLYRHKIGEKDPNAEKEEKVPVEINSLENTIYKGFIKDFECDFFQLVEVDLPPDLDRSQPMTVYCKFGTSTELVSGEIKFKNNYSMVLQLPKKIPIMAEHEVVTLYNKEGAAAKLLGRGKILYRGSFVPVDRAMRVTEILHDEDGKPIVEELTLTRIGFKF
ncbi:MAG: hypothetical protein ACOYL6_07840 [Bacteriovoracaceae bacterium]